MKAYRLLFATLMALLMPGRMMAAQTEIQVGNAAYLCTYEVTGTAPLQTINPKGAVLIAYDRTATDIRFVIPSQVTATITLKSGTTDVNFPVKAIYGIESSSSNIVGAFERNPNLKTVHIPSSVMAISQDAFKESRVQTIVFDGTPSLTTISKEAFSGCTYLTTIDLPSSLTSIGNYAFQNCTSLTDAELPASLTTLGTGAFKGCTALSTVKAPWPTPPTIDEQTFPNCESVTLKVPAGTIAAYQAAPGWRNFGTITDGIIHFADANVKALCTHTSSRMDTDGDGELSEAEAAAVTKDKLYETFRNLDVSKSQAIISFDELKYFTGLSEIGDGTFSQCTALKSVTLPTTITSIGNFAFDGCAALENIVLNEGLTTIGRNAFEDYTGIVTLPSTVTNIDFMAFYNCAGLKVSWTTPPDYNNLLESQQFGPNNADPKKPIYVPIGSYDAYHVTGWWAFDVREYGIINFADAKVKAICVSKWDTNGDGELSAEEAEIVESWNFYSVFQYNAEITTFDELKYFIGMTFIPESAFNTCTNLSSITLPRTITEVKGWALFGCTSLTSIDIPEGVKAIGQSAFYGCSSLTEIGLYYGLETIGEEAFTNTALERFTIPGSVTSMDDAFRAQTTVMPQYVTAPWWEPIAITENTFPMRAQATLFVPEGKEDVYRAAPYWQDFGTIVAKIEFNDPAVKAICVANWDTDGDGELTLDEAAAVTTLGTAFKGNTEIRSFDELKYFTGLDDGTEYHNHVLTGEAFMGCSSLVTVTLPANITRIYNRAFKDCTSLKYVNGIPDAVWDLGDATFSGCTSLQSLNLPTSIGMINRSLFNGCSSLRWITIPERVTYYGNEAFAGCTALTQVTVKNPTPATGSNIDGNPFPTRADINLIVPAHSGDAYRNAPYWQEFKNFQEQEPAWLTYTDENGDIYQYEPGYSAQLYRYADKSGRTTFVMPESITVDGVSYPVTAIAGLHSSYLQSLTIPASVTTVKDEAFSCLIAPDQGLTLKEIRMLGSEPPVAGSFSSWTQSLVVYNYEMQHQYPDDPSKQVSFKDILLEVPAGTKADYQAANLWKEFTVKENEAYAHVSADGATLTFYYDELKAIRGGHVYPLNEEYDLPQWTSDAWNNSIQTVVFDTSFAKARPTTTAKWFVNMENLTSITGLENLNTSEVTNMMQMFSYCKQLTSLDLSTLNTEKVQTMYGMFMGCENLTSLNLSNFNTAAVFNMSQMFTLCTRLNPLDISSFNTANVTLITNMFSLCESLMTIYVGNGWSTANVDKSNLNNYCDIFRGDNMLEGGAGTHYTDYQWSTEGNDDIEYARVDAPGAPGFLTFNGAFIQGDVNGDGVVTIADVTSLVNIILGKASAPASGVADVNGDHAVTIADVTSLVNIILGKH